MVKLNFWKDQEEKNAAQKTADEGDALRGNYSYEDLDWRRKQHLVNPLVNGVPEEEEIDTMLRQLSIVTNGSGTLGADFPITPENAVAWEQLIGLTRWAHNTLKEKNHLRKFLERKFKDKYHTVFNRSLERDQPKVVLSYKPMFYPGSGIPPTGESEERRSEQKKP